MKQQKKLTFGAKLSRFLKRLATVLGIFVLMGLALMVQAIILQSIPGVFFSGKMPESVFAVLMLDMLLFSVGGLLHTMWVSD